MCVSAIFKKAPVVDFRFGGRCVRNAPFTFSYDVLIVSLHSIYHHIRKFLRCDLSFLNQLVHKFVEAGRYIFFLNRFLFARIIFVFKVGI